MIKAVRSRRRRSHRGEPTRAYGCTDVIDLGVVDIL
jgi:hypothetical protein